MYCEGYSACLALLKKTMFWNCKEMMQERFSRKVRWSVLRLEKVRGGLSEIVSVVGHKIDEISRGARE